MKKLHYFLFAFVFIGIFSSCSDGDENPTSTTPTIETVETTSLTTTSAVSGGNVTNDGGDVVTARGVCWSTSENPTIEADYIADNGDAATFVSNITGLTPNTTYYVRAYATNSNGTAYGQQRSFTTLESIEENTVITANGVSFTMIPVEGGTFFMGAQSTDAGSQNYDAEADADESPVHQVTVSSYSIGQTEVTQAWWYAVMEQSPTSNGQQWTENRGLGDNYPAYNVNYNDVQNFITELNRLTGRNFRLPTEAEWEFAARGGNQSNNYLYSGSNMVEDVAWYNGNTTSPNPVASKTPNELGLYDMAGNVWEWCSDRSGDYSADAVTNPTGPESGNNRIYRGGSWYNDAQGIRITNRGRTASITRSVNTGFRLVL